MIPVEIRMALWDLMDVIEKVDGLTVEDKAAVDALYGEHSTFRLHHRAEPRWTGDMTMGLAA